MRLPHPVRAAELRLTVLAARLTTGSSQAQQGAVGIADIAGAGVPRVRPVAPTAPLRAPCGAVRLAAGARAVALRVSGTAAALDAGRPLAARGCSPVPLAAGERSVRSLPGPLLVDELELRSAALRPPAATGRGSWLVLGQGYDRGWRASCDGRSLGAPVPIDGYANGWPIASPCRHASFSFGPQRAADVGYFVSLAGALLCLGLCLLSRSPRGGRCAAFSTTYVENPARRLAPSRAMAGAIPAAVGFGFVFGARAGGVALPLVALGLWRGVGAAPLAGLAGGLLAVPVPLLYLFGDGSAGGNNAGYAAAHMTAHWLGVAALGLMLAAAVRVLTSAAARPPARGRAPARDAAPG